SKRFANRVIPRRRLVVGQAVLGGDRGAILLDRGGHVAARGGDAAGKQRPRDGKHLTGGVQDADGHVGGNLRDRGGEGLLFRRRGRDVPLFALRAAAREQVKGAGERHGGGRSGPREQVVPLREAQQHVV